MALKSRWLLCACLLLAPGVSAADEPLPSIDRAASRFERAVEVQVDAVLGARVDLASERALALLEDREAERRGERAEAPPRRPLASNRPGFGPVQLVSHTGGPPSGR